MTHGRAGHTAHYGSLAVSQLPPLPRSPSPSSRALPPKTHTGTLGNITFLKFALEFNLCLECFQTKQRERLRAGTRLPYGARQAPSGCGRRRGTSITSRLRTASLGRPGLTPSLLPPRGDENGGWGRAVGTVRGIPLFTHKRGLKAKGKELPEHSGGTGGRWGRTWTRDVRALPPCTCSLLVSPA